MPLPLAALRPSLPSPVPGSPAVLARPGVPAGPADGTSQCSLDGHLIPEGTSKMSAHLTAAMVPVALSTQGLVTYLQGLFGPLFLGIVGIVAIFFLFTREITRFVQFMVLAVAIAVVFYTPSIVQTLATGIANALGVH